MDLHEPPPPEATVGSNKGQEAGGCLHALVSSRECLGAESSYSGQEGESVTVQWISLR